MTAFFTAPAIAWGPGAVEQLSSLAVRRAVVIVDPAIARTEGVQRVLEELAKTDASVETIGDVAEPDRVETVYRLRERLARSPPDCVVAVGGGRTLDGAKGVRLALECPDLSLEALPAVLPLPERPTVQLIAIPTTSGSGADASWTADLTAPDGTPLELSDRRLVPDWTLVDPAFAATVPAAEVVPGALEAAAVGIEAYLSAWSNPFSDALALDAVTTIVRRLPHAVKWSSDPDARAAIHYAATAAGLAASNAQRGVAHALARALVGPARLPYARLIGIVLPHVLEYDRPAARDRLELLATAVLPSEDRTPVALVARLRRLYEVLRCPPNLAAAGVALDRVRDARDTVVAHTLRSPGTLANPRVPNAADVATLLESVLGRAVA
ncbi:MAG TPA: iron-containing alcohol dehydrogenase [Thermoplasmata archaeon]|nr:iron-containing alcohol dehydrogenase [Thermoplasmata archaeon]